MDDFQIQQQLQIANRKIINQQQQHNIECAKYRQYIIQLRQQMIHSQQQLEHQLLLVQHHQQQIKRLQEYTEKVETGYKYFKEESEKYKKQLEFINNGINSQPISINADIAKDQKTKLQKKREKKRKTAKPKNTLLDFLEEKKPYNT